MNLPTTFEQNVKERIKIIIGDLIPEEMWDKVVRETISSFLRDDISKLVRTELTEKYRKVIQDELNKPEWQEKWDAVGASGASEMVVKIIKNSAGDILSSMIGGITQRMILTLRQQIQQWHP